jgi:hypothetical protein
MLIFGVSYSLDDLEHGQPKSFVGNEREGFDELESLPVACEGDRRYNIALGFAKERTDRGCERTRNVDQTRTGNAIGAVFILLDLLKANANALSESRLRHSFAEPVKTNVPPYHVIKRVFISGQHRSAF